MLYSKNKELRNDKAFNAVPYFNLHNWIFVRGFSMRPYLIFNATIMSREKSNKVSKEVFTESEYSFIFGLFHFKGKVMQSKSNRILNTMIGCAITIVVFLALLLFFIIWDGLLSQAIQVLK